MVNGLSVYRNMCVIIYNMDKQYSQKWLALVFIDQDGHGVDINNWIFNVSENKIIHRGKAYANYIYKEMMILIKDKDEILLGKKH